MERGPLPNAVLGQSAPLLEELATTQQAVLIGANALHAQASLDLGLEGCDGAGDLRLDGDGLASHTLDEDLHGIAQTRSHRDRGFLKGLSCGYGQGYGVTSSLSSLWIRCDGRGHEDEGKGEN